MKNVNRSWILLAVAVTSFAILGGLVAGLKIGGSIQKAG